MSEPKPQAAPSAMAAATRVVKAELTLPSGISAIVYRGKGKDQRNAGRVADPVKEGVMGYTLALLAQVTELDGRRPTYEDMLELDLEDINALNAAMGKGATVASDSSSVPTTSPS